MKCFEERQCVLCFPDCYYTSMSEKPPSIEHLQKTKLCLKQGKLDTYSQCIDADMGEITMK